MPPVPPSAQLTPTGSLNRLPWQRVTLPGNPSVTTLTGFGTSLLVGAYGTSTVRPQLFRLDAPGRLATVPVHPTSPYAYTGRWTAVTAQGGRIVALAGKSGGAHGNVRWTVWQGGADGLVEQPQTFETFGGQSAGDLVGVAYAAGRPLIAGSWQGARAGLDVAVWTVAGDRWTRLPSTGTPLQSTATVLGAATSATTDGSAALLSGSITLLGAGSVRVGPAVWHADVPSGPWMRTDLPTAARSARAESASCVADHCLVLGQADGLLAAWTWGSGPPAAAGGVPPVPLAGTQRVVPPVVTATSAWLLVPSGSGSVLLRRDGAGWSTLAGPTGSPLALARVGATLYAAVADASGVGSLWSATS